MFKKMAVEPPKDSVSARPEVPDGLLKKCNACKSAVFVEEVKNNYYICPHCRNYFRVHAHRRVEMIADEGTFEEWNTGLESGNPLNYKGYEEKLEALREKTQLDEAVLTGKAQIHGMPTVLAVCDGRFLMASMGEVVGEKITRAVERATQERLPVIIFACSGGARMQEGIVSLMQMAKTSAALKRHSEEGLLYISVLTDPTTGGVTASFAMLGDIILAEPRALIGFAGPRVIEQTIGQKLPKGFQRSEFLLEHGFIDGIVERENQRDTLGLLLKLHAKGGQPEETTTDPDMENPEDSSESIQSADLQPEAPLAEMYAWDHVLLARDKERPTGQDYIDLLFTDFVEMHGDRYYRDDPAVIGGIAYFHGRPVTVIVQEKGYGTKENIARNFGMVSPDGYRKSLRLMKQAEKFGRPVICLVDTPGAFCGLEAEERGQGEAIARNLYELSGLKVPVLSLVIGEGGSGGALAFAVADEVWMLEHSIYSILSPEGFASILWKDSKRAKEAAKVMKLTAGDLKHLGIIEKVIREEQPLTRDNMDEIREVLENGIADFLARYSSMTAEELTEHRYQRFRRM
jgi:acetyl-CoA carboxylase carboxyl transferase subunit beta